MSKGILGKKLGMSGVFTSDGRYIPVTILQAGPCVVTQIKTEETDGYNAIQVGFEEKRNSRINKPLQGHFKKSGGTCYAIVREFRIANPSEFTLGQTITAELFKIGERVDIIGTTKGRGFAGVIKKHGFQRGRKTHGSNCYRIPGSVGASAAPGRVIKGKRLPGHYGNQRKTLKNLQVVDVRVEENIIMLKGAVPGAKRGFVTINKISAL